MNNDNKVDAHDIFKKFVFFIAIATAVMLVLGIINSILEADGVEVTKKYNEAVREYNKLVDDYEELLKNASIDNIDGLGYYEKLAEVSEDEKDIQKSLEEGNTPAKIKSDTKTIREWCDVLEDAIKIVEQITNPDAEWVAERLGNIKDVTESCAVTLETDVNGMLGKDGGYTSCIYFGISSIDSSLIEGKDIVAKGTDAGGAIEVYATVADAEARCEYLSEYENTFLYSGSYAIVGTMVIRTSYKLTPQEQLDLTDAITKEFTKLY